MTLWWCPSCGMVWAADEAPICRHNAPDVVATDMEALPGWHPFADEVAA